MADHIVRRLGSDLSTSTDRDAGAEPPRGSGARRPGSSHTQRLGESSAAQRRTSTSTSCARCAAAVGHRRSAARPSTRAGPGRSATLRARGPARVDCGGGSAPSWMASRGADPDSPVTARSADAVIDRRRHSERSIEAETRLCEMSRRSSDGSPAQAARSHRPIGCVLLVLDSRHQPGRSIAGDAGDCRDRFPVGTRGSALTARSERVVDPGGDCLVHPVTWTTRAATSARPDSMRGSDGTSWRLHSNGRRSAVRARASQVEDVGRARATDRGRGTGRGTGRGEARTAADTAPRRVRWISPETFDRPTSTERGSGGRLHRPSRATRSGSPMPTPSSVERPPLPSRRAGSGASTTSSPRPSSPSSTSISTSRPASSSACSAPTARARRPSSRS